MVIATSTCVTLMDKKIFNFTFSVSSSARCGEYTLTYKGNTINVDQLKIKVIPDNHGNLQYHCFGNHIDYSLEKAQAHIVDYFSRHIYINVPNNLQ